MGMALSGESKPLTGLNRIRAPDLDAFGVVVRGRGMQDARRPRECPPTHVGADVAASFRSCGIRPRAGNRRKS